jgi:hypothetical protein
MGKICNKKQTLNIPLSLMKVLITLLKLSRVGPGQSLDGRPDAAGRGVGGPVGGTLSIGLKNIPMPQGSDWGHWGHIYIYSLNSFLHRFVCIG